MLDYSILVSALAGLGLFFSPCILPILPAFISYLAGNTIKEIQTKVNERPAPSITSSVATSSTLTTKKDFTFTEDVSLNQNEGTNPSYGGSRSMKKLQDRQRQSSLSINKSASLNIFLNTLYLFLVFH